MTTPPPPSATPPATPPPAPEAGWSTRRKAAVWAGTGVALLVAISAMSGSDDQKFAAVEAPTVAEATTTTTAVAATTTTMAEVDPFAVWLLGERGTTVMAWLDWTAGYPNPSPTEDLAEYCLVRWVEMVTLFGADGSIGDVEGAFAASPDPVTASAGVEAYTLASSGSFACSLGDFEAGVDDINASAEAIGRAGARFDELILEYGA